MPNFEAYEHFEGRDPVWVMAHLRGKHRKHCLCHQNCMLFKPNEPDNCEIAQANFENCMKFGTVQPMWECPKFDPGNITGRVP
jgi:hypothetical protein